MEIYKRCFLLLLLKWIKIILFSESPRKDYKMWNEGVLWHFLVLFSLEEL